jgi:hypothetical protein
MGRISIDTVDHVPRKFFAQGPIFPGETTAGQAGWKDLLISVQ